MADIKSAIYAYSIEHGHFTVPAIAQLTGFSNTTVIKQIRELEASGSIYAVSQEETGRKGRRATIYAIRQRECYFLGVDVKNFELRIGLMDLNGTMVSKSINNDYRFENNHGNFELVCSLVNEFISGNEGINRSSIAAATFILGGRVDSRVGSSASIFNFEDTRDTPLADILTEQFGFPVFIENDTKAMASGEYFSIGRKWPNVLYVNFSWGLGLGIIINGELYTGSNGYSGEFGHMPRYDNNIICYCGKKGCLETEVSGSAVQRKLVERIRAGESSLLSARVRRGDTITFDDIVEATEKEDPLCIEIISETSRELGRHMAGMINLFNPDCIILGGSFSRIAPYYSSQQVILAMRQYSLKLISSTVSVLTSKLGDDAGIVGACLIARSRALANSCSVFDQRK